MNSYEHRIAFDNKNLMKKKGFQLTTPDADTFRKTVHAAHQNPKLFKSWAKDGSSRSAQ